MAKRNNENMVKARLLVLTRMFQNLTDESNPMDADLFEYTDGKDRSGLKGYIRSIKRRDK